MATIKEKNHHASQPLDRLLHAYIGKFTCGISPASLSLAFRDWFTHLNNSPGKMLELLEDIRDKQTRFMFYSFDCFTNKKQQETCVEPSAQDHRFETDEWSTYPFNFISQAFLLMEQWWTAATTDVPGVSKHHEQVVSFAARQLLDMFAPSNFIPTNPEILTETVRQGGMNLIRGSQYWWEDQQRNYLNEKPAGAENFKVGEQLAITPGKVVYRNELIELIQYEPVTQQVYAEPILIVPAWIMKYYILDLSRHNSLARYLVEQGYTVFMISWKNPTGEDRHLSFDDYRRLGVDKAIKAIDTIVPKQQIHLTGYCLGGTLAVIDAAYRASKLDKKLKSLTLLATQTDFTDAGELMLFIDESQVNWLEDIMWERGYLDKTQMAGAFQLLRSNDLIWSRMQKNYLLGKREEMFDLMAWNADATRMPYRMHSQYLHQLFLNNELAEGKIIVHNKAIAISNIDIPIMAVATEKDHVAPWMSVYKLHLLADTDITFLLSNGGHNAGIVSEPGHPHRLYRIHTTLKDDIYIPPDQWYKQMTVHQGSWWPAWLKWLERHRTDITTHPPEMGAAQKGYPVLDDAPGTYVYE
jgi:polyhydroxyalkanoate synthase